MKEFKVYSPKGKLLALIHAESMEEAASLAAGYWSIFGVGTVEE